MSKSAGWTSIDQVWKDNISWEAESVTKPGDGGFISTAKGCILGSIEDKILKGAVPA